jgi:hypothetical protein
MSLYAKVKRPTGAIRHHYGHVTSSGIVPDYVEIVEVEGGFLLTQYDKGGNEITELGRQHWRTQKNKRNWNTRSVMTIGQNEQKREKRKATVA